MRLYKIAFTYYEYYDYLGRGEDGTDIYLDWVDVPEEIVAKAILNDNTLPGMDLASLFKKGTEIYKKLYDEEIEYDKHALAKLFIEHCDDVDKDEIVDTIITRCYPIDEDVAQVCWEDWCETTW